MGWPLISSVINNESTGDTWRHTSQKDKWLLGTLKACNCGHLRYWLCRFYSSSGWFSWAPSQESLIGGNALNGFRHSLSVPCCNVNARTVCVYCQPVCASVRVFVGNGCLSYYQGNPEIGDSIRVGHVIQGWDPASVYWLPSLPIRQNISVKPCRLWGLTLSFLDVHYRQAGLYSLHEISRLSHKYNFVLPDLPISLFSAFLSFLILTFGPGCCFPMNPCVIGVDIRLASPVSGDSVLSSGQYETAGLSLRPL